MNADAISSHTVELSDDGDRPVPESGATGVASTIEMGGSVGAAAGSVGVAVGSTTCTVGGAGGSRVSCEGGGSGQGGRKGYQSSNGQKCPGKTHVHLQNC